MPEYIEDKKQYVKRSGPGSSNTSLIEVKEKKFSEHSGMEGYDYAFVYIEVMKNGKTKKIRLFSKSIESNKENVLDGRISAEKVIQRHSVLKKIGIPVPPTMRISEDRKHILMTDMTEDGKYEIIDNHNAYSKVQIQNLQEIKDQVAYISTIALQHGYVLSNDAYAIQVDKKTNKGNAVVLDMGSGIYGREKLEIMHQNKIEVSFDNFKQQLAKDSYETFNEILDLMNNTS